MNAVLKIILTVAFAGAAHAQAPAPRTLKMQASWPSTVTAWDNFLRTPPEILTAFLKAWDEVIAEESGKNPFFKKVIDSQREYASVVVPAKRFLFPPYSFAANYYWPEKTAANGKKGK